MHLNNETNIQRISKYFRVSYTFLSSSLTNSLYYTFRGQRSLAINISQSPDLFFLFTRSYDMLELLYVFKVRTKTLTPFIMHFSLVRYFSLGSASAADCLTVKISPAITEIFQWQEVGCYWQPHTTYNCSRTGFAVSSSDFLDTNDL